jgi:hypothetical protein
MLPRLQQFIRERQYRMNVSPATMQWYTHPFKWLPSEAPSPDDVERGSHAYAAEGIESDRVQNPGR